MPSHSLFVCSPFQMLPDEVYECSSCLPRDRYKSNLRKHPTVTKALKGTVTLTWGQSVYLYFFTSALHVSFVISLCFRDCYNKLWNMSKELRVLPTAPSQTKWVSPYHGKRHECSKHSSYRQLHTSPRNKYPSLVWKTDFVHLSHCNFSLYYRSFFLVGQMIHIKIQGPPTETSVAFHNRLCSSVCVNRSLQLGTSASRHHSSSYSPRCHLTSKTSYKTSKICMYIICFKMLRNPQKMNG